MTKVSHDLLLIIDFGSQVTKLIARRLRELKVYCEIHPYHNISEQFLRKLSPKAVILSGGPASVTEENSPRPPLLTFNLGVPILGICYGQQVMMKMLGGNVVQGKGTAEFGRSQVAQSSEEIDFLRGWFKDEQEEVWMSHDDHVSKIAPKFKVYGTSINAPFAIVADIDRHFYAVQFHPEVNNTPNGVKLFKNFV
ncbi:MAG: GMP synthase (glutamine-hydrolyzing), partial [Rhodobacteraceae bacterium]